MNERDWAAVIRLLDDKEVSGEIRKQILEMGTEAITPLESLWEKSEDTALQSRIEDLLQFIQSEVALGELKNWRMKGAKDLLEGWLIVTHIHYPKIELEYYHKQFSRLASIIWLDMEKRRNYRERLLSINYVLYKTELFYPEKTETDNPDRYYLKSFMESKAGNDFSLNLLYLIISRMLEFPVTAYIIEEDIALHFGDHQSEFYIDAMNFGNVFHREYIDNFIRQSYTGKTVDNYPPASNRELIAIMINALANYYQAQNRPEKVYYLNQMKEVLR